jgi:predicted phage tail protein
MAINKQYVHHGNSIVPRIVGSKGGKGGGSEPVEAPNSLFSTDILYVTTGIGEGPIYRVNPNGPQDIQIQDGTIDDLINLDGDGGEDNTKFKSLFNTGTTTQAPLEVFGQAIQTPQTFTSAVRLKFGNLEGIPAGKVTLQDTSQSDWDALTFNFIINQLAKQDDKGNTDPYEVGVKVTVFARDGQDVIKEAERLVTGKTTTPFKFNIKVTIPEEYKSVDGYRFTVEKTTKDSDTSKIADDVQIFGWSEIENSKQAYPRTAVIGYALKAENEHTGGVPSFTSLIKGLLVKVPSNYNQPILQNGDIDWREIEVPLGYRSSQGYRLQKTGTATVITGIDDPQLYVGTWDGTFVYSWTQNTAWIIYDILTNTTYGLGIAEDNLDKFRFYQIAQYCDACDITTGKFVGVNGMADGSFRYKPRTMFTSIRENQIGLPKGTVILERRFITDLTISEQSATLDLLNTLAGTIRAALIYTGGKISLAIDMPDEFPVMLFNEANIKEGSFQISGTKESDILTGVDVSYIEPSNHFKREVVRIDSADANDGADLSVVENIASIDLLGVTRRSQAMRAAQYQIASTKYLRRSVTFTTGTEGVYLSPGDVISVATQGTGIAYGFGGKIIANSAINSGSDTNVTLEHFTVPSLTTSTFTSNTYPLALRVIRMDSDQMDVFLLSNSSFELFSTGNVGSGSDTANVQIIAKFDPITKTIVSDGGGLSANVAPRKGDLWSLGQWKI